MYRQHQTSLIAATVKIQWIFLTMIVCTMVFTIITVLLSDNCAHSTSLLCTRSSNKLVLRKEGPRSTDGQLLLPSASPSLSRNGSVLQHSNLTSIVLLPTKSTHFGRIITTTPRTGRLGNHLFQLASAYGIAKQNDRKLVTYVHFDITDYFETKLPELSMTDKIDLELSIVNEAKVCGFDKNVFTLEGHKEHPTVYLHAYNHAILGLLCKCLC